MMKAAPFVVAQAEFLLQFLIIPFDDPAVFGQVRQLPDPDGSRQSGEPILAWLRFPGWPFHQQPFLRMRFGAPIVTMSRTHPHGGEALPKLGGSWRRVAAICVAGQC